jgi:hypothetical protein
MSFTARTITDKTHAELKALAGLHTSFDAFLQDVQRLAEKMWHNAKSQNEEDQSVQPTPAPYGVGGLVPSSAQSKTDAQQSAIDDGTAARNDPASNGGDGDFQPSGDGGNEPAPAATLTPGPTDDGEQVTQPAEPASPVSEAGFPTTNVDVAKPAGDPVLVQPVEPPI